MRGLVARVSAAAFLVASLSPVAPAHAQRIENPVAVFAALDKVTAKISMLQIKLGETVRFGSLKITARTCYTRRPIEPPRTTSFVEIDEIMLSGQERRVFAGWMFAESPGLNALEHPVFDVWLTGCQAPPAPAAATAAGPGTPAAGDPAAVPTPAPVKKRPRR